MKAVACAECARPFRDHDVIDGHYACPISPAGRTFWDAMVRFVRLVGMCALVVGFCVVSGWLLMENGGGL